MPRSLKASASLGIELDRLRQIGDRLVEVALAGFSVAARAERDRQLGIELDGLVEILDGAVVIALLVIGDAAIIERGGVLRVELVAGSKSWMARS